MTLEQFRQDKQLVAWARSVMDTDHFRLLMGVMRESHPKNFRSNLSRSPVDDYAYALGRVHGYDEFENNLNAAMELMEPKDVQVESTFKST